MRFFIFVITIFSLFLSLGSNYSFAAQKENSRSTTPVKIFSNEKKSAFYYSRTKIILIRKALQPPPPPPEPLPWLEKSAQDRPIIIPPKPPEPYSPLTFDVEIRDGMSLSNQKGWFNLSSYSEQSGVMLTFSAPSTNPIIRSAQYAPTDILFIDKQGKITQIVPNIILSSLEQDIYPSSPVLAFLFLKGGLCEKLSINAGDEIQHSMFKKPPTILNAPKEQNQNETPQKNVPHQGGSVTLQPINKKVKTTP